MKAFRSVAFAVACGLLVGVVARAPTSAQSTPRALELPGLSRPLLLPSLEDLSPEVRDQLVAAFGQIEARLDAGAHDEAADLLANAGRLLARSYRREAALAAFQGLLDLRPGDFSALYLVATLHAQLGQDTLAEAAFERALEVQSGDLATLVRLGRLRLRGGDVEGAERVFRAARAKRASEPAVLFGLGEVRRLRGDCEGAVELYAETLRLQPGAAAVHYPLGLCMRDLGDVDSARRHLSLHQDRQVSFEDPLVDDLVASRPGKLQLLQLGMEMSAQGRTDDAVRAYEGVLALEPANPSALRGVASGYLRMGQVARGREALERLVAAAPRDVRALTDLGQVHRQLGNLDRAIDAVGEATRLVPSYARAHLMLGELLAESGDMTAAEESVRRAYSATREIEADRDVRGWSALLLGRLVLARSPPGSDGLALVQEAGELLSEDADAQRQVAQALVQASEFAEGALAFERAAALAPGNPQAHFASGLAFMLAREDGRARAALERALVYHGTDPQLRDLLARLLACSTQEQVRDPRRSVELARGAFEDAPTLDRAETLAMALVASGDVAGGSDWLRQALARARSTGDSARAKALEAHLERVQGGQSCSAPWLEER